MITEPWWIEDRAGERWRATLLTHKEATKSNGELKTALGGNLEWNVANEIRFGGSMTVAPESPVDWHSCRVRIDYIVKWGGVERVQQVGILIPVAPKSSYGTGGEGVIDLELYDKTLILIQDTVTKTTTFKSGRLMTDAIEEILKSVGERYAITHSSKKFAKNRVYPAGTTKMKIVQEIVKDLDYFGIYADPYGVFQVHPYVEPDKRQAVYVFREGATAIHSPDWSVDHDGFEVPNRVVCISQSYGKTKAKVSIVEDLTSTKWGYNARGRWVTRVETGLDIKKQSDLDAKARLLLKTGQAIHDVVTFRHLFLPLLPNDRVRFDSQGYAGDFSVQSMRIDFATGALADTTLEGINNT